VVKLTCKFATV